MIIRAHLFTFRESSIFMSKAEICFMLEGTELWTSFTSPRRLNTEFLSYAGNEVEDFPPVLVLVKTKGLGSVPPFSL